MLTILSWVIRDHKVALNYIFPKATDFECFFCVLIDHLLFFFWELTVQFICPFTDQKTFWCLYFADIYIFLVSISCLMYSWKDFMSICEQLLYFAVKKLFNFLLFLIFHLANLIIISSDSGVLFFSYYAIYLMWVS